MSDDILGMSDEDFEKLNNPPGNTPSPQSPGESPETPPETQAENQTETQTEKPSEETPEVEKPESSADEPASDDGDSAAEGAGESEKESPEETPEGQKPETVAPDGDKAIKPEAKEGETETEKVTEPNYQEFYKQIMAPFKANGKTFTLQSPEEAIRLMQMGAGYGRKLQDLQPVLKTVRMLEKNDLMDEEKLSFLIELNNKNPDAIKKFIKDSNIDPLDLNVGDNIEYKPVNHSVPDSEMAFQEALSEVQAQATGPDTIRIINQTWDNESKALLGKQPQLLTVIQSQRDDGTYDLITAEIDRQKLLGKIPHNTSFMAAYKMAGDYLVSQNQNRTAQAPVNQPTVVATRPAAPKVTPRVANNDKAQAAAPTKTTPRKAAAVINPLAMSDEDFEKQFAGRF